MDTDIQDKITIDTYRPYDRNESVDIAVDHPRVDTIEYTVIDTKILCHTCERPVFPGYDCPECNHSPQGDYRHTLTRRDPGDEPWCADYKDDDASVTTYYNPKDDQFYCASCDRSDDHHYTTSDPDEFRDHLAGHDKVPERVYDRLDTLET